MEFNDKDHPHRRYNPLNGQWVLVSPHRSKRPWKGQLEDTGITAVRPNYDPTCYLCPGNERYAGSRNPNYTKTFVFTNDFPALLEGCPRPEAIHDQLLVREGVSGTCRVICFSPMHDRSLAQMDVSEILNVINLWTEQNIELGQRYRWVQIFENKGATMGSSNPHPHGQIWAQNILPAEALSEDEMQKVYLGKNNRGLLLDYAKLESECQERIVVEYGSWMAVVPYWALWPYETLVLCREPVKRLDQLDSIQRDELAHLIKSLLVRYDNLFQTSFPYSMGWHGAPWKNGDVSHWQVHAHFFPPLLRSATVKKFMVGYEMLAEAQRDLTPEQAAEHLRSVSSEHYLQKEQQ